MIKTTLFVLVSTVFVVIGCGPAVKLPPVQESLDSGEWERCDGELQEREAIGLIDDLTLDSKTLLCRGVVLGAQGKTNQAIDLLTEAGRGERALVRRVEGMEIRPGPQAILQVEGEAHRRVLKAVASGVGRDVQEEVGRTVEGVVGGEERIEDADFIVVGILVSREEVIPEVQLDLLMDLAAHPGSHHEC